MGHESVSFALLNRGNALDLKNVARRARLQPLVKRADVIVEQFRPGVMKRLGLDYDSVAKLNPMVVYCSISGYGQSGLKRDVAAHDLNYIGDAGLLALSMGDLCRPVVPPALIADIAGGAYPAVLNILLFCDLIGLEPELRNDEKNSAATKARVAAIIATETADTWRSRFAGKDCCCSIVAGVGDAFADPHYVARGVFQHALTNPEGATIPALPVPLDPGFRVAPEAAIASPAVGADNKKYLA